MSQHNPTAAPPRDLDHPRIAIINTEWNARYTLPLTEGAVARWHELGYDAADVKVYTVPGAIELTYAASHLIENNDFDAIIVIGTVIRGDTPHFDYVCQSVTQGITHLNAECDIPVIFGVLTVNNEAQVEERLDKGAEWLDTALKMISFRLAD